MTTTAEAAGGAAGNGRRLGAAAIDAGAIGLVVGVVLAATGPRAPALTAPGTLVLTGAVAMFYRMLSEGSPLAATPGKRVMGLRIRALSSGRLDFAVAALRAFPWWLSGALAGVDPQLVPVGALLSGAALVPILFDAERRGLHDRLAGTAVVNDDRTGSE